MEVGEKIAQMRQEKKLSRQELYQRLRDIFGQKAVTPNTIWRIESGLTSARTSSLHQISTGLGISLKDLLPAAEAQSKLVDIVKKGKRTEQYVYNENAKAEVLTPANRKFLAQELILLPGGKTKTEEDPIEVSRFEKWIYCLSGEVACTVGTETHVLKKGDCLSFESNIPHLIKNNSSRKSRCLIVQNPRYI